MTHDQQFIKIGQEHRNGNKTQQREREGNARVSKTIHSISISGPEFHAIKQETSAARSNNNSRTINNGKQCAMATRGTIKRKRTRLAKVYGK